MFQGWPPWGFTATMLLAAAGWGLGSVMSKVVLNHVLPFTLLPVQLAASLSFLWAMAAVRRIRPPLRADTIRLGLTGVLNPGLAYTFGLLGLARTTASLNALIWATEPILILGLAWLILRERLSRPLLALSLAAIVGVMLVAGIDSGAGEGGSLIGNLLVLAGTFCCALYTVLTRRIVADLDPLSVVTLQQTAALAWALLIWPLERLHGEATDLATISLTVWALAAASGLAYYALAFWFYIIGLKRTPASLTGQFLNLVPIFGVGGAYLFIGERLAPAQWIGAIVILGAVTAIYRMHRVEVIPAERRIGDWPAVGGAIKRRDAG